VQECGEVKLVGPASKISTANRFDVLQGHHSTPGSIQGSAPSPLSSSTPSPPKSLIPPVFLSAIPALLSPSQVNTMLSSPSPTRRLIKFTGTFNGSPCVFMLDSGATGNFVSNQFVQKHGFSTTSLPRQDTVTLADGSTQTTGSMMQAAAVRICSYTDRLNFVTLPLTGYDVILGMPWLYHYNPVVDWQLEMLTFVQHCKRFRRKRVLKAAPPTTSVSSMQASVPSVALPSSVSVPSAPLVKSPSVAPSQLSPQSAPLASASVPSPSVLSDTRPVGLSVNLLSAKALKQDIRRGLVEQVTILRHSVDLDSLAAID
jgi:hypothetical protein